MKKSFVNVCVAAAVFATATFAGAETTTSVSPEVALQQLMAGNSNFVNGSVSHLASMAKVKQRLEVAKGQHPIAIIVACSDSRVPPELLFDMGLGELFVVRVAGNIVGEHEMGSIEYAAEHLGVKLIMVLGHERCGAVTATYNSKNPLTNRVEVALVDDHDHSNIDSLVRAIAPAVNATLAGDVTGTDAEIIEECAIANVEKVAHAIEHGSELMHELIEVAGVKVVKAKYDLDSGKVVILN